MNLRHALLYTAAVVAIGGSATSAQAAATVSATFTKGAVAEYDRNPNQTDRAKLFSELGIASITISQANGTWGGSQGNDTTVSVTLTMSNGSTQTFTAAINWLQKTGNTADWVGLTISPTTTVNDGYTLTSGFEKTFILEFAHSSLVETLYASGEAPGALDGSADTNGALNALNALAPADNTAPIITGPTGGAGAGSSSVTVNENQTGATRLTANEAVTWSITGGTEAAKFNIAADGTITFKAAPDYEAPTDGDTNNSYVLIVTATDTSGNTSTQTVTVNVANVNDTAPVFTNTNANAGPSGAASYNFNYAENSAANATLGTVSASGAGTLTYSIASGNDNGWYAINASTGAITLTTAGAASLANDYELAANTQTLTVQVSNGALSSTITVALNETNVDDTAPVITGPSNGAGAASSAITVNENQTAVTKPTANEAVTWAITGGADANKFNIAADGTITFKTAPDYEAPTDADTNNAYVLIVEATDTNGNKSTQTITVNVADVNDNAPVFTNTNATGGVAGAASYSFNYAENRTAGATLGTVSASGAGTLTYSITNGNGNGWYAINSANGAITLTAAGAASVGNDYEQALNSQTLTVQVSNGSLTTTILVALNETDLDDAAPAITGPSGGAAAAASAITVNENQTAVAKLNANEGVTWAITGGTELSKFAIAADGTITFKAAPDYEAPTDGDTNNTYILIVEATDTAGNKSTQTITVTVANVNDTAPVFTNTNASGGIAGAPSYAFSYAENQAADATLGSVSATGGSAPLAYSIVGGNANGWYAVNPTTGVITLTADGAASIANDYERTTNSQTLIVQVSDGPQSTLITVALGETDLDDTAPLIAGPRGSAGDPAAAITVNEGQTAVAQLTASEGVTWAITGGTEAGKFAIAADGTITFTAAPDYEAPTDGDTNNTYVLIVEATDPAGNKSTQTITVTVADIDDTAPVIAGPNGANGTAAAAITVNENQTAVTKLTASEAVTWSLVNDADAARFTLAADGTITFKAAPDYETPTDGDTNNTYVLTVQAVDAQGNKSVQTITVTVANLDDTAPVITGPSGGAGAANSAIALYENQTAVTRVTANETVTWSITGGADAAKFAMAADGTITFVAAPDFENPTDADRNNTYLVQVTARDATGNSSVQTITVTVMNVDEITAKLNAISDKLRGDLRGYAFNSLQDMLSFNEGMMQAADEGDGDCGSASRRKALHGSAKANENGQDIDLKFSRQVNACAARIRVFFDMGLAASSTEGNANLRGLASVRAETKVEENITLGVGVLGSFSSDELPSFAISSISDESLQGNFYVRARLSEKLRAGAFGSLGKAWYRFGLHDDGFHLSGSMTGDRYAYGAMLSGDATVAGIKVTTDVALSRAVEKLNNADLSASYKGESRSGIAFLVGTVDATRLSVPAHMRLISRGEDKVTGRSVQLTFSPGLLCEDRSADASNLTCGYQIGGKFSVATSVNDRAFLDARHEDVSGTTRDVFSFGYAHTWGPVELGVSVDKSVSAFMGDSRAMLRLRFMGR